MSAASGETPGRAWRADLRVAGLSPKRQAALDAVGALLAERFGAQFGGDPTAALFHFRAARFVRRALADLCWPGPAFNPPARRLDAPLRMAAPDLVQEPELQSWLRVLPTGVEIDPERGELVFEDAEALLRLAGDLTERMRLRPPERAGAGRPETIAIPARTAELEKAWGADPRTRPLRGILRALRKTPPPPGVTPILFGSLADPPPWPAYADVDLALHLSEAAMRDAAALLTFIEQFRGWAPLIAAADPLQHHGPYVLFEANHPFYSPAYLPPRTLELATTLTGAPLALEVQLLTEDRNFALESLVGVWRGLRHLVHLPWRALADRYTAKYCVSLALLAPALWCGAMGRPVDKAASFALFKAEADPGSVATIEALERLRREWRFTLHPPRRLLTLAGGKAPWLARTVNRAPNPELAERLRALAPRLEPLFEAMLERIVAGARGANS